MEILIKVITGKTIILNVDSYDQIKQVKEKIQDKEKISIDKQRLIFLGKPLENNKTLSNYNIKNNSYLYLVLK